MKTETKKVYPASTMRPAEVPEDIDQAYGLVQGLVFDQVHKFQQQYGGDRDDLLGEAHMAFMLGHQQFVGGKTPGGKPITAPYAASIRMWVWYRMFDAMRARIPRNDRTEAIWERDFEQPTPERWDADEYGFDEDARYVVDLLTDPPKSLAAPAARKGGSPRNLRSTAREWLVERGWTPERVAAAFAGVKAQLAKAYTA